MLSKNKIKFFNSLKLRKYRNKHKLFIAEGEKITKDFIDSGFFAQYIITVSDNLDFDINPDTELILVKQDELKKITDLKTASELIAIFEIPEYDIDYNNLKNELTLFCDGIQNPGNLGTIIRTADWFGIKNVICTQDTVDVYNSKVVQASMGAIGRVKVHYVDKLNFFNKLEAGIFVYGTFLNGENLYEINLEKNGIIIIGNEGSGISKELNEYITKKINIPNFSKEANKSESLNASIATAVICAEFRRRT